MAWRTAEIVHGSGKPPAPVSESQDVDAATRGSQLVATSWSQRAVRGWLKAKYGVSNGKLFASPSRTQLAICHLPGTPSGTKPTSSFLGTLY